MEQQKSGRGIVLDVTQDIIDIAVPEDSGHCIVADALRAAVPNAERISVDIQTVRWTDRKSRRRYIYLTPAPAQAILANFDLGVIPEPQRVRLGRPAQIVVVQDRKTSKAKAASEPTSPDASPAKGAGTDTEPKPKRPAPHANTVVQAHPHGGQPTVVGRKAPPTSALSTVRGRRRTFGLRSLRTITPIPAVDPLASPEPDAEG